VWRASRSKSGTAEFDVNGFLAVGEAPAQAELLRSIESPCSEMGAARMPKGSKGQKRPADVIGNSPSGANRSDKDVDQACPLLARSRR